MRRRAEGKRRIRIYKGFAFSALFLAAVISFSGCGADYPDLSDEQVEKAGEYAAMMLLKYDSLNRSRLMDIDSMQREEARREAWAKAARESKKQEVEEGKEESSSQAENKESDPYTVIDNTAKAAKLSDGILLPAGVEIDYKGYVFRDQYPEGNDGFAITANSGMKLLVLRFGLRNTNDGSVSIDLLEQDNGFVVTVNGNYSRRTLMTLLDNDLGSYSGKLMPGESTELVLMIEVDQGTAVESLKIKIKNDRIECTIPLEP